MIGRLLNVPTAVCLAILVALAPVAPVFAQQATQTNSASPAQPQPTARSIQISNQNYDTGKPWFPKLFAPYTPTPVPEPILLNSPSLEQMIRDGKLQISLQEAIDLALQNNLDISIQRYTPWLAEANILRARAGAAGSGTIPALGNIPALNFDPQITSTLSLDDRVIPANNPVAAAIGGTSGTLQSAASHSAIGDISYSQAFPTGTTFSSTFNNSRASSSSSLVFFNPSVTSNFIFTASQQLLNGFGLLPNDRYLRIAKLNKNIADQTFQQQVITSITAVANAYWELVFARGNVDVARQELELANKTYGDNKKQVDVGTLAPLEIVQAEALVATANQALIVDQTTVLQDQLALLNLISKDPNATPLQAVEIIPTDTANDAPPEVEKIPLQDLVKEAITKRPDVLQSQIALKGDNINVRVTKNALLPTLTLSGEYATAGLSGNHTFTNVTSCTPTPPAAVCPPIVTGLATSLGDMFSGIYPEYNAQLSLIIPIRNRAAQANNVTALLDERLDQARYQQIVNNASIDVHNAQIILEQARVTLAAAGKTRDLDQQTLDAEQKKYQVGASTLFNIVSDQNTLVAAESAEVRARVNLAEGKVNFDRAMARTLDVFKITIADAKAGKSPKDTLIPGTSAGGQLYVDPAKRAQELSLLSNRPGGAGSGQ